MIGVGWVGLVTAACFAELGHPVIARDIVPEKVEALSRGRDRRSTSPASTSCSRSNAERLTFTTEMDEVLERRAAALRLRRHAADLLGRRRPLARCEAVVEELRADGDHVLVMKSTVPGRHRRRDPPRPPRASPTSPAPSSSRRASAVERLHAPRPRRDRRRSRRRGGGRRGRRRSTSRSAASSSAPTSPAPR